MFRLARVRKDDRLLDVACGTGDVCRTFGGGQPAPQRIVGLDFAAGMLALARLKAHSPVHWCRGDGTALPFRDGSFSLVTCAFGVRNFQDLDTGLREMYRVLTPGGRAVVLEFGMPSTAVLRGLYGLYFRVVMPLAATVVSRDRSGAYRYLPRSVLSFCDRAEFVSRFRRVGFADVEVYPQTLGIVSVFLAHK